MTLSNPTPSPLQPDSSLLNHLIRRIQEESRGLNRPLKLILALSGGSDSIALLHLLLKAKEVISFHLEAAHLNHNWRASSGEEAEQLAIHCHSISVHLFLKALDPIHPIKGNLEDAGRQARLQFFQEILVAAEADLIITAHHATDAIETMLKRIFEGAHPSTFASMQEKVSLEGVTLWRPLLPFSKEQLLPWCHTYPFPHIEDHTNLETRFLRGRIRTLLVPTLNQVFQQDVQKNLLRLLHTFNELKNPPEQSHPQPEGLNSDSLIPWLQTTSYNTYAEIQEQVRTFFQRHHRTIPSFGLMQQITQALLQKKGNLSFHWQGHLFIADRGYLFYCKRTLDPCHWNIAYLGISHTPAPIKGWQRILSGQFVYSLPLSSLPEEFHKPLLHSPPSSQLETRLRTSIAWIPYPPQGKLLGKKKLSTWWNDHKVPQFLWRAIPLPSHDEIILGEPLSGYTYHRADQAELGAEATGAWLHFHLIYSPSPAESSKKQQK
jgi:tRNA(Ile)-lysidine synthase